MQAYEAFVKEQRGQDKLSKDAFDALHRQLLDLARDLNLSFDRLQIVMETALILGDMGKAEKARQVFSSITAPDHDDFEKEALEILKKQPELCPSFERLHFEEREIIIRATGLIHFGHVYHLEGGPEIFSTLKGAKISPPILDFALFVQRCDVAGALAHRNPHHSITFTQITYEMYEAVGKACRILFEEGKTEIDAYKSFLSQRGEKMGLSADIPMGQVLIRVAAMLRLFSSEEGKILQEAFSQLSSEEVKLVLKEFSAQKGILTPTYIPAVLLNLMNNEMLGAMWEERLKKAVTIGLPLIARALEKFKAEKGNQIRACFNSLAGQAKGKEALFLNQGTVHFDLEGNVTVTLPLQTFEIV